MGEQNILSVEDLTRVAVDTYAGRIHVEWDPDAAVTPMGQLLFFIEFLKASGLLQNSLPSLFKQRAFVQVRIIHNHLDSEK